MRGTMHPYRLQHCLPDLCGLICLPTRGTNLLACSTSLLACNTGLPASNTGLLRWLAAGHYSLGFPASRRVFDKRLIFSVHELLRAHGPDVLLCRYVSVQEYSHGPYGIHDPLVGRIHDRHIQPRIERHVQVDGVEERPRR